MFSEIELPPDISSELRTNTALIVNHLAKPTDAPNRWRRRAHAPSVILVPERSGAIAASGILDWYERHHVEGLELIVNGIVTATFGAQPLTDAQRYELGQWLRGRRMAQRPQAEHSGAVGAAIERGVDPAEAPAYVMSLSAHLRRKVAATTRLEIQQGRAVCVGPDPSTEQQP